LATFNTGHIRQYVLSGKNIGDTFLDDNLGSGIGSGDTGISNTFNSGLQEKTIIAFTNSVPTGYTGSYELDVNDFGVDGPESCDGSYITFITGNGDNYTIYFSTSGPGGFSNEITVLLFLESTQDSVSADIVFGLQSAGFGSANYAGGGIVVFDDVNIGNLNGIDGPYGSGGRAITGGTIYGGADDPDDVGFLQIFYKTAGGSTGSVVFWTNIGGRSSAPGVGSFEFEVDVAPDDDASTVASLFEFALGDAITAGVPIGYQRAADSFLINTLNSGINADANLVYLNGDYSFDDIADGTVIQQGTIGFAVNPANDTFTVTSHGFVTGDAVRITTAGTLPGGLAINTTYYIIKVNANDFKLATSAVNAAGGTAIDITNTGSGLQTIRTFP
jgi:hypothetical protein